MGQIEQTMCKQRTDVKLWLLDTGWNDKIVTLEKTTWFHFRFMKTGFLFLLQTSWDLYTTGQLVELASCVQIPRAIGAFYHVWKWDNLQRARSEMRRYTTHPSYDNRTIASTLKMQVRTVQRFRLRLWTLVWFQVRAKSCHLTSSKSA